MKKGFLRISGVGVRPAGKKGMVIRVRFESGDVVTLTGKQVRCLNSLARIIAKNNRLPRPKKEALLPPARRRHRVPGAFTKML